MSPTIDMRVWLTVALGITACGGKSTQSTMANDEAQQPTWEPTALLRRVSVPRPALDVELLVPDFHEELRWPLTAMSHPELAPQFEIASVFAEAGVGWLELCERGVQNRVQSGRNRDELEYLRGWCSAVKGDADSACGKLMPLTTSAVLGMSAAVRIDVANIIASAGDIDKADKLLNKHKIRDVDIYDTLSATYLELGMETEAHEMNRRAMDLNPTALKASTYCRRLVKDIVLGGESGRVIRLEQLKDMATKPKLPDETCAALYREAKCFVGPAAECDEYFRAENIDPFNTYVLHAYRIWPTEGAYYDWLLVAEIGSYAGSLPGARELVDLAMDTALQIAPDCSASMMQGIYQWTRWSPVKSQRSEREKRLQAELDRCKWKEPAKRPQALGTTSGSGSSGSATTSVADAPSKPSSTAVTEDSKRAGRETAISIDKDEEHRRRIPLAISRPDCADVLSDSSEACMKAFCGKNPTASSCTKGAPPSCNAVTPKDLGLKILEQGMHAAALAQFERSLRCEDDLVVRQLAFVESCASGNSPKAKIHFSLLTPSQQTKWAEVCLRQKPPVAYE